ncbi:MAG: coproporphyrinogen dehydrogenase HemZ [Lachnospiraceae bacterium]|nr:coproporphyrinogen dehydrogenase HemZ [Lachnospiraceae bacterium]
MITVTINQAKFEYDIHSLVKAFYPSEDVKVTTEQSIASGDATVFSVLYEKERFSFSKAGSEYSLTMEVPEGADRITEKNIVKRLVYTALSDLTGKALEWGDLTGIRPTKIARKLLDEGKSADEILRYMKETYLVGDKKGHLAIDIATREREILKPLHIKGGGYSMYIGIPFCPSTCLYCSFTSNPIAAFADRVPLFVEALMKEIRAVGAMRKGKILDSLYIGGGTPTSLEAADLERILECVSENFDTANLLEYTVEAGRPDSITEAKLKVLKKYGVTRISVNPQTMNDKTLKFIGRHHTSADVINAFNMARAEGFDNINTDIILGLPGEGEAEVRHTIDELSKLKPDSLTVHSLAIKRASALYERIEEVGYDCLVNTDATMEIAAEGARKLSMKPYYLYRQKNMAGNYENTGYAREGAYGIYNILIMEELESIAALGPGSVSKVLTKEGKLVRDDNVKDVMNYIERIYEMIERKRELFALE